MGMEGDHVILSSVDGEAVNVASESDDDRAAIRGEGVPRKEVPAGEALLFVPVHWKLQPVLLAGSKIASLKARLRLDPRPIDEGLPVGGEKRAKR
jgi:hypothetical protein